MIHPINSLSAEMEKVFLDKYQEYCKVKDGKDELFQIKQGDK